MFKYKYLYLLIILLIVLSFFKYPQISLAYIEKPLIGKVIFIDPGHGGRDPGTIYGTIYEKDINLLIAKTIYEKLSLFGASVYMTRDADFDLSSKWDPRKKRGDLYRRLIMMRDNEQKVDLYLSIHINWYRNSYWKGAEVLYNPINKDNIKLADAIMNRFRIDLGSKRSIAKTDLYMYRNTTIVGVLIECGFLSNAVERRLLQKKEYQEKLSLSIANGVIDFFNTKN